MKTSHSGKGPLERLTFPVSALLIALAAVVGFAPNSVAIITGRAENPALIIHVHAAVMSAWVALLVAQSVLVYRGRIALHRRLGTTSMVLAPIIVGLMILIAIEYFPQGPIGSAVVAVQLRRILLFTLFITWALWVRKSDPQAHKRLMVLATIAVIDAAFFRMSWFLPDLGIDSFVVAAHIQQLALIVPILMLDFKRYGRPHAVTLSGIMLLLAFTAVIAILWPQAA